MYALLILMTIIVGCAPKVNYSFVLEVPITYEEEKRVADSYPVEPVEIKDKQFEDIIFPADKVEISDITYIFRIQKVNNLYSWRENNPILLSTNECDEYIRKNTLSVLSTNELKIWKIGSVK